MFAAIPLAASLVFSPADAAFAYDTAKTLVCAHTPRDAGTVGAHGAADFICDAATKAGARMKRDEFSSDTPKGRRDFVNLHAEFMYGAGDDGWVILVSHYDTKPGVECPGANDGASTSGLLVGMARAVAGWIGRHGNLMLIWTDGEECMDYYCPNDGFWGSKRAAAMIRERGLKVRAVICLDMIGDRDLAISVPANGTPSLARIAVHAARRAGHEGLVTLSDDLVKDDHAAFLNCGYKAIDLIDFSYGPHNSFWHTSKDTMDNVSVESLKKSGDVVVEMLNILL